MNNQEEKIRSIIERELKKNLDINSFLTNTQAILKHLPSKLATAIASECFTEDPHPEGCYCKVCINNIFDELETLVDLNS